MIETGNMVETADLKRVINNLLAENKRLSEENEIMREAVRQAELERCHCKPDREETWQKEFQEIMEKRNEDNVNHPAHYGGAIEVIDFIRDKLTPEELSGYYKGNILKYIARFGKKQTENPIEDIQKAQVYLGWLVDHEGGISNAGK